MKQKTFQKSVKDIRALLGSFNTYLRELEDSLNHIAYESDFLIRREKTQFAMMDFSPFSGVIRPIIIELRGLNSIYIEEPIGNRIDALDYIMVDNFIKTRLICVKHIKSLISSILGELIHYPEDEKLSFSTFKKEDILVKDSNSDNSVSVQGDNINLVIGSTNVNQTLTIQKFDDACLENELNKIQINSDDIKDLKTVLKSLDTSQNLTAVPEEINDWIMQMLKKANSGIWEFGNKMGITVASSILTQTILSYLGLK